MTDTYKVLLSAWRSERQKPDIQPLPEGFYQIMTSYINQIHESYRTVDKDSLKGKLIGKEKEHAERMLAEITNLRLGKIIHAELKESPLDHFNLVSDEKRLHVELRRLIANFRSELKKGLLGKEPLPEPPPLIQQTAPIVITTPVEYIDDKSRYTLKVVRFLQPLPAIMGIDMRTYGPFKAEDVASLPAQNADNLIRKGIAKEVETQP